MSITGKRLFVAAVLFFSAAWSVSCRSDGEKDYSGRILKNISVPDAYELISKNKSSSDFIILDMRTAAEYKTGHIKKSVNVDFYSRDFREKLDGFDKSKTYLIYCRTGGRTGNALMLMRDMGFLSVYNMSGGIESWRKRGLPIVE